MAQSDRLEARKRREVVKIPKKTYDAVRPHGGVTGGVSVRRFVGGQSLEQYSRIIDIGLLGLTFLAVFGIAHFWKPSSTSPPAQPQQTSSPSSSGTAADYSSSRGTTGSRSGERRDHATTQSKVSTSAQQTAQQSASSADRSSRPVEAASGSSVSTEVRDDVPRLIEASQPANTPEARAARFTRPIAVSLTVDENGVPRDVELVAPAPFGLGPRAIAAVREWRYQPARKNGQPVSTKVVEEVRFR